MAEIAVSTRKYDMQLERLLSARLDQCGCAYALRPEAGGVRVLLKSCAGLESLADALSLIICYDLQYLEIARMADALPLPLKEKQHALREALRMCHQMEDAGCVREGLHAYLAETPRINLEGYLQFRLRDMLARWEAALERAAAEQMLDREYLELMGVLAEIAGCRPPAVGDVAICIKPDGSLTLTDESDACIEYVDCSEDGIISLLIGMSPKSLTVYDISGGSGRRLTEAIARVFAGRVRIYR